MIADFAAATPALIEADLCIIGGGMAGIAMAHRLDGAPLKVCVLESGGHAFDADTQSLYAGSLTGLDYFDPTVTRLRFFGGSSNHWTGQTGVLEPHDMLPRPWVPGPGWPIERAALDPWYAEAARLLRFDGTSYAPAQLFAGMGLAPSPFAGDALQLHVWRHSAPPMAFGDAYGPALARSANVQVWLHANVVDILAGEGGREVTGLSVRSLGGFSGRVRARAYVLACGGIETPRLLLNATGALPMGLGNAHDQVGRCFMEHPNVPIGRFAPAGLAGIHPYVVQSPRIGQPTDWRGAISLSPALRTRARVLGGTVKIDLPRVGLLGGSRGGGGIGHLLAHPRGIAGNLWRRATGGLVPVPLDLPVMPLVMELEQAPDPASRVSLGEERDALGLRQPVLHWRLGELERATARAMAGAFAEEFGRQGWGRFQPAPWLGAAGDAWPVETEGAHHHMGTTRMSREPRDGVVDAQCRVHGTANLYIAGTSVFPTGGYVNPSLTLLALALRLAEELRTRLG